MVLQGTIGEEINILTNTQQITPKNTNILKKTRPHTQTPIPIKKRFTFFLFYQFRHNFTYYPTITDKKNLCVPKAVNAKYDTGWGGLAPRAGYLMGFSTFYNI
jgi:hypothetical protein